LAIDGAQFRLIDLGCERPVAYWRCFEAELRRAGADGTGSAVRVSEILAVGTGPANV
jgi:hypothetical protein